MRTVGKVFKKEKQNAEKLSKKQVMAILREKGIEFDEKAPAYELIALIPKGVTT